jgi:hypothetical protein
MATSAAVRVAALFVVAIFIAGTPSTPQENVAHFYLGFDRNDYPGDAAMKLLRRNFAFTGYWLGNPPGGKTNTWAGKRDLLRSQGFGFLVLYAGRDSNGLKNDADARLKGARDAEEAIAAAKAENFSAGTIIFLDIEEGGRLPDTYHTYLAVWSDALTQAGYRPGVYCSGIPVKEEPGVTVTTADDIRNHAPTRDIGFWVFNDACPPSPGCTMPQDPPAPSKSGIASAQIWQFVRSPRDKQTARHCRGYAKDGNCYAALDTAHRFHLDVNSATSTDPSGGAK